MGVTVLGGEGMGDEGWKWRQGGRRYFEGCRREATGGDLEAGRKEEKDVRTRGKSDEGRGNAREERQKRNREEAWDRWLALGRGRRD